MNPYFLESLINSITIVLIIFIIFLLIMLLVFNFRSSTRERELRENNRQLNIYRNLFNSLAVPAMITTGYGKIIDLNDAAVDFLDNDRNQMIGEIFDPLNLIASSPKRRDELREAVDNNKEYNFDSTFNIKGETVDTTIEVIRIHRGNHTNYLVSIIPKQRFAGSQLDFNLSEERINKIEDMAEIGFFIFNHDTNEIQWSRGMYNLLKLPINTTKPNLDFLNMIHEEDREEVNKILMSIKNQTPYFERIKIVDNEKKIQHVDVQISHQEGIFQENSVSLGTLKNVNTLDKILENFNIEEGNLNFVRYPNFFFLALTDENDTIIRINQTFTDYLGTTQQEAIGTNLISHFNVTDQRKIGDDFIINTENGDVFYLKRMLMDSDFGKQLTLNLMVKLDEKVKQLAGPAA